MPVVGSQRRLEQRWLSRFLLDPAFIYVVLSSCWVDPSRVCHATAGLVMMASVSLTSRA
jgi:hypothetical protein